MKRRSELFARSTAADTSQRRSAYSLNEKALSLDIYKITHDTRSVSRSVRERIHLNTLKTTALTYVCVLRMNLILTAGDTFTVSPYGSDEEYSMKVNGIIQSVSESIVITDEYAESLGIPRTADSVYTPVQKAEIPSDGAIKSVQSKQAIIDSFDTFTEIMDLMIFVLIFAAVILCTVVLYNLGVMSYAERYREMATLKVVGFKDKKIAKLLISQNLWITFVGVLIGLPGGYLYPQRSDEASCFRIRNAHGHRTADVRRKYNSYIRRVACGQRDDRGKE